MKPLRQAVVAIISNEKNEVLIGNSPRDGGFKFPQGGLDPHETKIEGLIRELEEELGIIISEQDIITRFEETAIYIFPDELIEVRPFRGQELHVFHVKHKEKFVYKPQDDEFDIMLWKRPQDILSMDLSFREPAYLKALKMCGLL